MQHPAYDDLIEFATTGPNANELAMARGEYAALTGDLFESDQDFESRIASFLEWYTLDRQVSHAMNATPARLYIDHVRSGLTTPELAVLRPLTRTRLTLLDVKRVKPEVLVVKDLLVNEKLELHREGVFLAGVESGDVLEGRVFPEGNRLNLSDNVFVFPRTVRKSILKFTKTFKRATGDRTSVGMVQRCSYLRNRAMRYGHVDVRQIFRELAE